MGGELTKCGGELEEGTSEKPRTQKKEADRNFGNKELPYAHCLLLYIIYMHIIKLQAYTNINYQLYVKYDG